MLATKNFKMRVSPEDKTMLVSVAKHLQRSQSDAVKTIVREVYAVIQAEKSELRKPNQKQKTA
jgi:hypothetical protein